MMILAKFKNLIYSVIALINVDWFLMMLRGKAREGLGLEFFTGVFIIQSLFIVFLINKILNHSSLASDALKQQKTMYRVMKILFRKYVHDVANKIQILLGQHMMARKGLQSGGDMAQTFENMKTTLNELTQNIRFIRSSYLTDKINIINTIETSLENSLKELEIAFEKRLAAKNIQIIYSNTANEINVLVEPVTFQKYVLANIIGEVIENAVESSIIEIEVKPNQLNKIKCNFHFTPSKQKLIDQFKLSINSAIDEDSPLLVANDFIILSGGHLKFSNVEDKKQEKIRVALELNRC